ncbi:MAG: MerR family transcriptional regulator [Alphaproteobacteria bacterium]
MDEVPGGLAAHSDAEREQERQAGQKSPDAFRTISEVSSDLDVPQHVLRFWEGKFAQIRPLKRGGGRRYYRPDDVDLLRGIQHLLHGDGYTIKGVQKLLREHGVKHVVAAGRRVAAAARAAEPRAETPPAAPPPAPRPVVSAVQPPPAAAPALVTPPATGDRIEMAARLFARLKALKRDYDQKLQAAKSGR